MKQDKRKLIESNQVSELSSLVFNQHFDNSCTQGFTDPLDFEEEVLAVQQMLKERSSEWYEFMHTYMQHYPLSNQAANLLASSVLEDAFIASLLKESMLHYGCFPEQAEKICSIFIAELPTDTEIINIMCDTSRVNNPSVRILLERLETRMHEKYPDSELPQYVERYDKSIKAYINTRI